MGEMLEYYRVKKLHGELPDWQDLTADQITELCCDQDATNRAIAELFSVTSNQVQYKKGKLQVPDRCMLRDERINAIAKEYLLAQNQESALLLGLLHYIFRNGPIEDFHANGQLSETDMMTLNKYMVNRLATVFMLARANRWMELEKLLDYHMGFGQEWDQPEIDIEGIDFTIEELLSALREARASRKV